MTPAAERTRVAFAGRTDAGVHATGQVAVVRVPAKWTPEKLRRALNARLPEDIAVLAVVETAAGFDPRRCARRRRYEYRVLNGPVHSPLMRQSVWHVRHPLDDDKLRAAGALLVGKHDFAAFGGPVDPPRASTVREMFATSVERNGFGLTLSFEANAFLPHQGAADGWRAGRNWKRSPDRRGVRDAAAAGLPRICWSGGAGTRSVPGRDHVRGRTIRDG